jgi:hypothetical protein
MTHYYDVIFVDGRNVSVEATSVDDARQKALRVHFGAVADVYRHEQSPNGASYRVLVS